MLPLLQRPLESSERGIAITRGGEDAGDITLRHETLRTQLIQLGDEPIGFSRLSGCSVSLGPGCDGNSAPARELDGGLEFPCRFLDRSCLYQRVSELEMTEHEGRIQLDGAAILGDRRVIEARAVLGPAHRGVGDEGQRLQRM